MTEYIERKRAIVDACNSLELYPSEYAKLEDALNKIPAADVAPVVKCQNCKHAWIHPCGYVYCHRDGRNAYEMTFNLDSFCSYGERNDNG